MDAACGLGDDPSLAGEQRIEAVAGKMWCIAELGEECIAHMEDLLAIYDKPLSNMEPVVCVDENPAVLHADARRWPRTMRPGRIARHDKQMRASEIEDSWE
jgi:hypothetical protein